MEWFCAIAGTKQGPYSLSDLKGMLITHQLDPETLIWREGLEHWAALSSDTELQALLKSVPPPLPIAAKDNSTHYRIPPSPVSVLETERGSHGSGNALGTWAKSAKDSAPWSRYFARLIDVNLYTILIFMIASKDYSRYFEVINRGTSISRTVSYILTFLIISPLIPLFSAMVITAFGNSPGKALFGLQVSRAHAMRGAGLIENISREIAIWAQGLWFYIPLLNVIPLVWNYRRVSSGMTAVYDDGKGRDVVATPIGPVRRIFAVLVFLSVCAATGVYMNALQKHFRINGVSAVQRHAPSDRSG